MWMWHEQLQVVEDLLLLEGVQEPVLGRLCVLPTNDRLGHLRQQVVGLLDSTSMVCLTATMGLVLSETWKRRTSRCLSFFSLQK